MIASVNYAADCLGLYRAELARILGLMCNDVSNSAQLALLLEQDNAVQHRAKRFLAFFNLLESRFDEDSVAMLNWFRRANQTLGTTPFLALVDEGRLEAAIDSLRT